ncbi:M16 family metallopeptidase [Frateuria aurantia]|uniref:Putative Zn-dependent peptidase n=1 Tax=Frateuria aurantia (strain ATCC 33424 / DSM 6220 / KCTC 2777 / LMG 1558 / NBRC 3245 / NCIMB 13370) TaxID=767434 RepID=H8L1H7_FRAAD|nr:pitrilysin family protein [Frateuria aurantia]AFC84705.1 putative Zn-dependent peptidase [Frateuria aurantia DSM 6220]
MDVRRLKPLACGVLLGLSAVSGLAMAETAPASAVHAPASSTLQTTLDNGLRVVIVHDPLAPTVTTQITYQVGSYQAPAGFPGSAHALEHMMFRDSAGMTGAQLNQMTGKMGAQNNAFTTNDATQYYFVAPAAYLDILLHIEATRMQGLLVTDKDWAAERGAIEQEVSRDISSPDYLAFQKAEASLFKGTGYENDALGSRPTFDATKASLLRDFHKTWYAPNNAILVVVGDVDPQTTLGKIKQLFGTIPKQALPQRAPLKLQPFKARTVQSTTPQGTGSIQALFRAPGLKSKDAAAFQVLLDVLNNPRSSLSALAAQGKVLAAGAQLQPFTEAGIGLVEVDFAKGADPVQARADMDGVLAEVLKNGVSPELVEAAKRSELAQKEFNKTSAVTLASAWSQALAWQGLKSPDEASDLIHAVTVDDVNRVAREWLQPDQRYTVVLTPDPNGKRPPDSSGFGGSESFGGDNKLDGPLPEWAARSLGQLSMPHWTLAPTRTVLPNGITLIVQPETISKTVSVFGHIDGDEHLQEPVGKDGVGRVLNGMFDYGTTGLDREAFHKALDALAAQERGGADFSLEVPSEGFDKGLQLLADNVLHPAMPESAFQVQQQSLARELAGAMQSPNYKTMHALWKGLLPAGDPGLREATPATVSSLKLDDVKAYHAQTFRPDLTTIVVVGDVSPASAAKAVGQYFGQWQAKGPKPEVTPRPVPVNPAGFTLIANPYAAQDTVFLAQSLQMNLANPDRYALQLGNEVLGGNGFASRLMTDIRVRHGYAYGADSGLQIQKSRSIFYVTYGSDPSKVGPVDALVRQNLEKMRSTPVEAHELENARQAQIRSIPLSVSSFRSIGSSLLRWSYNGEPLDQPMVAARHYLSLTAPQVQAAFKRYILPQHLTQVVQGPDPVKH